MVFGLIILSCRWRGEQPSWVWIRSMIGVMSILLYGVIDQRYYKPYRWYAMTIGVFTRGAMWWLWDTASLGLSVVLLYTIVLVTLLLSRMLRPARWWTIPLLGLIGVGWLMMIPRSPQTLSPTVITDTLPNIQLYRSPQEGFDENLSIMTADSDRWVRAHQRISLDHDAITIQYAAPQPHDNHVIIQLNNRTTIGLWSQSVLHLEKYGEAWSGSLDWSIARKTTDQQYMPLVMSHGEVIYTLTGQWAIETVINLDRYDDQGYHQIKNIVDRLRPSPWTKTTIGATLLRMKLRLLAWVDVSYHDDYDQLLQYQCLIYRQRCGHLDDEREMHTLDLSTWDADLQSTTRSGSEEAIWLWEQMKERWSVQ